MRMTVPLLATLALLAAVPAHAGTDGNRAGRLVGVWTSEGLLGPCGTPPSQPIRATIMFNAGGTVNETPRFPPTGIGGQVRTAALGTWSYDPATDQYTTTFQFDWYVNGTYAGFQVVERELRMDGDTVAGAVASIRYAADGSVLGEVCGEATSTRL